MGPWVGRKGWSPLRKGTIWIKRIEGKVAIRAYVHNKCLIWSSSYSLERNLRNQILISICLAFPPLVGKRRHHWKAKKGAKQQHHLGFALCGPKKIWMLVAPFTSKQLGCENTIEARGTPTKKLQGDLDLISMLKLLEGGMGCGRMVYHHHPPTS
jgi:hypothetical protein